MNERIKLLAEQAMVTLPAIDMNQIKKHFGVEE